MFSTPPRSLPTTTLLVFACAIAIGVAPSPSPVEAGTAAEFSCGGIVFDDRDADGTRAEALDLDRVPDDREAGLAGIEVTVVDSIGRVQIAATGSEGDWDVDVTDSEFPIRVEFAVPDGWAAGRAGPDAGRVVQIVPSPAACREAAIGGLGIHERGTYCAEQPEIAVTCFVTADHDDHDGEPAVVAVSNAATDNEADDATTIGDWLDPVPRKLATVGQVGSVYGLATGDDGVVYAAGFTKRHARSVSDLNPDGNPTVIYRLPPDDDPEVLTFVDPAAPNPHGRPIGLDDDRDLASMDAVFTSGLGDLEISADGRTLYTVDLGRRELVTISTDTGRVGRRIPLDGDALDRTDCNVSVANPFGDLRAFGLGWRDDDTLLVGVVCSGASSAAVNRTVREGGAPGPGLGDPRQLIGYVYEFADDRFAERLWWYLPEDRGETFDNELISNKAVWHAWTPTYPYDDEHDAVSFPQPAVSDLAIDERGNLVIALADRWGHQTAPDTVAPGRDGRVRRVTESVAAGDLVRACPFGEGWTIEGQNGCAGGFGNGWEFFDGDSYGWHAETAMGAVLRLPGRDDVVVTQMDPVRADDTWRSGGLAWHDTRTGGYLKGARLYDGRSAQPDHTFEKASGLGDLAALCGGPPLQIAGAVWHDRDADGLRDPDDQAIPAVTIELRDEAGDLVATDVTTVDGLYEFDEDNVPDGLTSGATYDVVVADENYDPTRGVLAGRGEFTGLVPTTPDAGIRDDLDSDVRSDEAFGQGDGLPTIRVVAGDDPATETTEPAIATFHDIGLRDRYDLAVGTAPGPRIFEDGIVSFRIDVTNHGSLPSGAFRLRASLPVETSLIDTAPLTNIDARFDAESVTWAFPTSRSIPPGAVLSFEMTMRINDPTLSHVTSVVEIVEDGRDDLDVVAVVAAASDVENDRAELTIGLFGFSGRIRADVRSDSSGSATSEQPIVGVVVHMLGARGARLGSTTTDDSGRFRFESLPAGRYAVEVPASEFVVGRPLHRFDHVDGAERADLDDADSAVRSAPFVLGPGAGEPTAIEIGFAEQPTKPTMSLIVPGMVLLPVVAGCVGLLLLARRRRVAGVLGPA
ncbi:MAG: hypothetical protein HKN41_00660 [Ilumatobacter sp.]|nr:hypothetical protein [Ilumatobacter sp.]